MDAIHITDIEAAINFWRERKPSPDGITLAPEIRALAEVYALMVYHHEDEVAEKGFPSQAMAAWRTWYDTTPDTPCIAICSTSQGDAWCHVGRLAVCARACQPGRPAKLQWRAR